jgi:hypothetical protein
MATLTEEQVDHIQWDIMAKGIRLEGLRDNLLDHICILVEERLGDDDDFETVYRSVLPAFYREDLYELEAEAIFLTSLKGPYVVLSRWVFLGALFGILLSPYCFYVLRWGLTFVPMAYMPTDMATVCWIMLCTFFPLITLLVVCFTPDRFDPLIPWRSKVLLGTRPLIRVLP